MNVCSEKNALSASLKKRRKDSSNACSEDKLWLYSTFSLAKKNTANIAKERLQIIVAERRRGRRGAALPAAVTQRYPEVICKYVQIDPEMVSVQLEQRDGDISILELNVTLPETEESKS
ncbi:cell division topological specificity factor MinE [Klebsiella pneumoniae]|uniref:Cell division topological specificity factor n=1 Tax=Klebsiella pneumoniae TaxID=573 RepID=A0A939STW0_KLEPN|nr:cell division topological specificity factor MinE [Klebsiella pneumoniae]